MDPDNYYAALTGAAGETARRLRTSLIAHKVLVEEFKHGHPVYGVGNKPICLVKAAKNHVLFALWEGRSLISVEPLLTPTGGANMASMKLASTDDVDRLRLSELLESAVALEQSRENGA